MKNTAVITPNEKDFRMLVLQLNVTEPKTEFTHIKDLESTNGKEFNDLISLTNSVKMPQYNLIVDSIQRKLVRYGDKEKL